MNLAAREDLRLGVRWTGAPELRRPAAASDLPAARTTPVAVAVERAQARQVQGEAALPQAEKEARQILRLIDALEENDDVQDVYSNFDISEELLEAVAG